MSDSLHHSSVSITARSLLFRAAVLLTVALYGPAILIVFVHKRAGRRVVLSMLKTVFALLRSICGVNYVVRGRERLPDVPVLLAPNHQSACDALLLSVIVAPSVVIMKSELLRKFLMGWILISLGHVPVERQGDTRALARMVQNSKQRIAEGDSIIIFPEGTRLAPTDAVAYKAGVAVLYKELKVPCVPVAVNSGYFWPTSNWRLYPGTIVIEFLEPMSPDLSQEQFLKQLRQRIDGAAQDLAPAD